MRHFQWTFVVAWLALGPQFALAQLTDDESDEFVTETVLTGLDNPWGLAIRNGRDKAGPHNLFIAESGAGRVIRIATDRLENVHEVVTGFRVKEFFFLPNLRVGPTGLAFLTRTKLIVANGTSAGVESGVRVYVLPEDNLPLTADQFDHEIKRRLTDREPGDLLDFTTTASAAYFTFVGDKDDGMILKANHEANRLESLRPFVASKPRSQLTAPVAVTVTPADRPQFLVVADRGSSDAPGGSRLLFYAMESGKLALSLTTGIDDVIGIAYSPSGQLYAVAGVDGSGQGGVYRLDDARVAGRQACRAVKIASVVSGVSLVFDPEGALYVTSLGAGNKPQRGSLIKITGNF